MFQMASGKELSGQVLTDVDLDYKNLVNPTSQATKRAEIIDATDVHRVDMEYRSFASSSEEMPEEHSNDPIKEFVVQASVTKEERATVYSDNINNEYDINSERASDDGNARLLMAMERGSERENRVLRELLRAPRYFDYPESLACNDFNGDGDKSYEEKAEKARKSCYICGDFDHLGIRCKKLNACNICSLKGHVVMNCPNKKVETACGSTPCLKCGNIGHDMFLCSNDYDPDDLKDIECYVCKETGHLCCAENKAEGPKEASCYRCGQSGHFGLECTELNVVAFDPCLICRICKERGHSRKQCPKKAKAKLRWRKYRIARGRRNWKQTPTGCTPSSRPEGCSSPAAGPKSQP